MAKAIDLTGQRFGRLTVLYRDDSFAKDGHACWICQCDCGALVPVRSSLLRQGGTRSCGCLARDLTIARSKTHGMTKTKIHRIWAGMKRRCFCETDNHYPLYGGRGITICDEWREDFVTFYDYVSKLEHFDEDGYTLDRINNNGNYEPGNVRWATVKQQAQNRRTSHTVEINGEKINVTEVARRAGVGRTTIQRRLAKGEKGEQLLRPSICQSHIIEINGEAMILADVARLAGVTKKTIYDRLARGETGERLLRPARAK